MTCTPDCIQPTPSQAHCGVCCRTFGSLGGFDRHRRGGQCIDPTSLPMHLDPGGIWRWDVRSPDALADSARRGTPQGAEIPSRVGRVANEDSGALETRSCAGELADITYKVPVIHCTPAEFRTELWWAENVDPVASSRGMADYVGLNVDPGDRNQHLLKDRDGVILLAVRTDLPEDA